MAVVQARNPGQGRPKSAKLAGLKFGLHDGTLPTLRKMDRDDVMQRLPHEHSRTSRGNPVHSNQLTIAVSNHVELTVRT